MVGPRSGIVLSTGGGVGRFDVGQDLGCALRVFCGFRVISDGERG